MGQSNHNIAAEKELRKLQETCLIVPRAKSGNTGAIEKMIDEIFHEMHNAGLLDKDTADDLKFLVKDYLGYANNMFFSEINGGR